MPRLLTDAGGTAGVSREPLVSFVPAAVERERSSLGRRFHWEIHRDAVRPRRRAVVGGASARVLRRSAQQNPYDVLGLSRSSNYDDIRAAFRKLARTDDRKGDLPVSCLQEKLSHSEFHDVAGHIIPMF